MSHNLSRELNPNELVPWQSGPRERGALGIILSCFAVIGTCTWTTLHLTVPDSRWSWLKGVMRKAKWMVIMVIFPEFVFAHVVVELKMALEDYFTMYKQGEFLHRMGWEIHPSKMACLVHRILSGFSASATTALKDTEPYWRSVGLKTKVWTLTHCYIAKMGSLGLEYRWGETSHCSLMQGDYIAMTPTSTDQRVSNIIGAIHLVKDDILDKSKADSFVRVLWVREIVRLIVDILARAIMHLPITQLEIITVSFTAISLANVLIQIEKPKDVSRTTRIPYGECFDRKIAGNPTVSSLSGNFLRTFSGFVSLTAAQRDELHRDAYEIDLSSIPATRIPNDYFRATEENERLFSIMLSLSTCTFGLIHCAAWAFEFPTVVEKWIWRGCALASIALPFLMLFVLVLLRAKHRQLKEDCKRTEADMRQVLQNVQEFIVDEIPNFSNDVHYGHLNIEYYINALERRPSRHCGTVDNRLNDVLAEWKAAAKAFTAAKYANYRWTKIIEWAQIPGMVVYFLTRVAIIAIAVACFRSAPRGIYWGTWVELLPAVR